MRPEDTTKGAMADASAGTTLPRDFGEAAARTIVVEFAPADTPAAYMMTSTDTVIDRLQKITGGAATPVFGRQTLGVGGAVPASVSTLLQARLSSYYQIALKDGDSTAEVAKAVVTEVKEVVSAIPEPLAVPALGPASAEPAAGPVMVPDLTSLQWHLGAAPSGLGVLPAWARRANGLGTTVVDVEGGWRLDHVTLAPVRFNLWSGKSRSQPAWLDHGTAVVGLMAAPGTGPGIVGICPMARTGMVSVFPDDTGPQRVAAQIIAALEFVQPGDVMLIELQRPGPAADYQSNAEQKGYVPVSFWPDVAAAISAVVEAGVCVIEVGGNGGENLDDRSYEDRFNQVKNDTGGIMVGAGAPPSGEFGPARSRLSFSNYGSRLDCQAGGQAIVTAGYGDLWRGGDATSSYTAKFLGTSSAGPLVAGVVACLQSRFRAVRGYPISPREIRAALATTGSPQSARPDAPVSQRIGPQPDLMTLLAAFGVG